MYNIDDTFIWIYRNNNIIQFNKNQQNFNDLYELINILKSNPSMIEDINKMKTKYYDLKKKYRNDKFVLNRCVCHYLNYKIDLFLINKKFY